MKCNIYIITNWRVVLLPDRNEPGLPNAVARFCGALLSQFFQRVCALNTVRWNIKVLNTRHTEWLVENDHHHGNSEARKAKKRTGERRIDGHEL